MTALNAMRRIYRNKVNQGMPPAFALAYTIYLAQEIERICSDPA